MTDARGRLLRTRMLALGILLAAFLAGGLSGVAFERSFGDDGPPRRGQGRGGFRGPPNIFAAGGELAERLDLTPEQVERIEAIVAEDRAKAQAAFDEIEPRLRARFDSTRAAISAVLTPAQREEFERAQQERRARLRERFGGPPGGRGGRVGRPPPGDSAG